MSSQITIRQAAIKYRVTQRTIHRWVKDKEIRQFENGAYDSQQLDEIIQDVSPQVMGYLDVDWDRASCKGLPTDFFYKIEDRGVSKLIDLDVFRSTCTPCPIWKQCLGYANTNENYGVWGGMTAEERRSLTDYRKYDIRNKVLEDFSNYGISEKMIYEAIGEELE